MRRLSLRAHSRDELARALTSKGIDTEVQEGLLERFSELDLVDDRAFAEQWVESRHRSKGLSRRALTEELRRKGIDAELVTEAVGAIDRDDEVEAAMQIARKKLRSMGSITDPQVLRRRLAGALARRGYGTDVVHQVVTALLEGNTFELGAELPE